MPHPASDQGKEKTMGTPHNSANVGDISDKILLPGDPMRAKYIAENFLEDISCYNEVRGMYGYTGYYKGKRVSVQGTGMGMPSMHIYANELMDVYGAIFTSDKFYDDNGAQKNSLAAAYGIAAVDMETCELYTLAAKYHAQALTMLTVSDHLVTGERCTTEERQTSFQDMIKVALEII